MPLILTLASSAFLFLLVTFTAVLAFDKSWALAMGLGTLASLTFMTMLLALMAMGLHVSNTISSAILQSKEKKEPSSPSRPLYH
ncbi:MAG: hypothetical protein V4526_00210 [Patescibacteria group bacterium]